MEPPNTRSAFLPKLNSLALGPRHNPPAFCDGSIIAEHQPCHRLLAGDHRAPARAVAEQADRLLKEVAAYIGSANEFTFHADITFDHVLPSRQKLQFSAAEEFGLQRPGRL